jgi:serine/threonine protein kinase
MTHEAGTKLGRYEIRSKLGAGGMGEVYRARDEKLNRDVAIKVLPAALSDDADRLHRFEQEAQAAGALNHPNILVTKPLFQIDIKRAPGYPYAVAPDGSRFLVNTPADANNPVPMTLILNWPATLKK